MSKQHLANTDKRAASKTRVERKMAAVREVEVMKGRSRAKVTPSVSRGRASTQEQGHSRRLEDQAVSGISVSKALKKTGRQLKLRWPKTGSSEY